MKLTKKELAQKAAHITALTGARGNLEAAFEVYQQAIADAAEAMQPAINAYEEAREAAAEWVEDIASQYNDLIADRSEKWQESEAGTLAAAWAEEWQNCQLEPLELRFPEPELDDITSIEEDHVEMLEQLPDEAG
jgi:CHASE3 domain sensor protein